MMLEDLKKSGMFDLYYPDLDFEGNQEEKKDLNMKF